MQFCPKQVKAAEDKQALAAMDRADHVLLVAGPGTGKSKVIERRLGWLLKSGVAQNHIRVTSFTRASSRDLRDRIEEYCSVDPRLSFDGHRVSTLHSLALSILKKARQLTKYPVSPLVFDDWEISHIFDTEFQEHTGYSLKRCKNIRVFHESIWSNDEERTATYVKIHTPITNREQRDFVRFHRIITQCYACVLPGEIVRQCVECFQSGDLDPTSQLDLEHLIVDEVQDLNSMDMKLIDLIIEQGTHTFIAGDDDQSIYSFRFAFPSGIREFRDDHTNCNSHTLTKCFRCMPKIVGEANALIHIHSPANRIEKELESLYSSSTPKLDGVVHHWKFNSHISEARAIAESCRDLTISGVDANEIFILIGNKKELMPTLMGEFERVNVDIESPVEGDFRDSPAGRFVLALMRIVCSPSDYIALRTLVHLLRGVGPKTCLGIARAVIEHHLNYREIFYQDLIPPVFPRRAMKALNQSRSICAWIANWHESDELIARRAEITSIVEKYVDPNHSINWNRYTQGLPDSMTLRELRDYIWAESNAQRAAVMREVNSNLGIPFDQGDNSHRVRMMTMHGAKGLSSQVVFIPGLEEDILPSSQSKLYPGLIQEAARLLYVSMTRARVSYIASYASRRQVHGKNCNRVPSRFLHDLCQSFVLREHGLQCDEIDYIQRQISQL